MFKKLGKALTTLILAIVLLWWLGIDWLVERVVEQAGTQAVGAKVELASAELSLLSGELALYGLQVTNPRQPMQNLFELSQLRGAVELPSLLDRRVHIRTLTGNDLRFSTARQASGAISGTPASDDSSSGLGLPDWELPDASAMLEQEKARLKAQIEQTRTHWQERRDYWEQRLASLPDKARIDAYRARMKALKEKNFLEQLTGIRELRRDVENDLQALKQAHREFRQEWQQMRQELADLKNLPQHSVDRLLAETGLQGDEIQWLKNLSTDLVKQGMATLEGWYHSSEQVAPSEPATAEVGAWSWLIEQTHLDGELPNAHQAVGFVLDINDIASQPAEWGKPLTFSLLGEGGGTKVDGRGSLDRTQAQPKDRADFSVHAWPLLAQTLQQGGDYQIALEQGTLDAKMAVAVTGEQLLLKLDSDVRNAKLSATGQGDTAQLLAQGLEAVNHIQAQLQASGSLSEPTIELHSNLDQLLGDLFQGALKAKASQWGEQIRQGLSAELGSQLGDLEGSLGQFGQLGTQLEERQQELSQLP